MVLEWISLLAGAKDKLRRDDSAVDRFHHQYTVIVLVVFAVVSTTHQLVGNQITCWATAEFQSGWIKYANTLCWVKNTYWLPFNAHIPKAGEKKLHEVIYYQWIPFIFLGMAIFFYLPSIVWTSFNSKAGVDSDNILESAEQFRKTEQLESKEKLLRLITNQLDRFVGSSPKTLGGMIVKKKNSCFRKFSCLCGKKFGNYLVILYIFTKFLYIGNVLAQLFVLNSVLRTDFTIFGIEAIKNVYKEREFLNHTIFPKVTMCDFRIRGLGIDNTRNYTLQCILPINLYAEKMFVFLWFWMVLVLFITIVDLFGWILRSALSKDRFIFIENSLLVSGCVDNHNEEDRKNCGRFVHDYLRNDGVFVLRLIAGNTNKITSSEIIASLWDKWCDKQTSHGLPNKYDTDESDDSELNIRDKVVVPIKPKPNLKPKFSKYGQHFEPSAPPPQLSKSSYSSLGYRPNVSPPPPPVSSKDGYPLIDDVDSCPGYPGFKQ